MKYQEIIKMKKGYLFLLLLILCSHHLQAKWHSKTNTSATFIPDKNITYFVGDLFIDKDDKFNYEPSKDDSLKWKKYSRFQLLEMLHKKILWLKIKLPERSYENPAIYFQSDVNGFEVYLSKRKSMQSGTILQKLIDS